MKFYILAHKIVLDHQKFFVEDPFIIIRTRVVNMRAHFYRECMHFYRECMHFIVRVHILSRVPTFTTIVRVIVNGFS